MGNYARIIAMRPNNKGEKKYCERKKKYLSLQGFFTFVCSKISHSLWLIILLLQIITLVPKSFNCETQMTIY